MLKCFIRNSWCWEWGKVRKVVQERGGPRRSQNCGGIKAGSACASMISHCVREIRGERQALVRGLLA